MISREQDAAIEYCGEEMPSRADGWRGKWGPHASDRGTKITSLMFHRMIDIEDLLDIVATTKDRGEAIVYGGCVPEWWWNRKGGDA